MSFSCYRQKIQTWGVLNVTPDSFSDGGESFSAGSVQQKLTDWASLCDVVDVGAQSTAPKALAIDEKEEIARLEKYLLPAFERWPMGLTLSLDTFRPATVRWLLARKPVGAELIWNDVSGVLDEESLALLEEHPELRYVLTFTQLTQKSQTPEHSKILSDQDVTQGARRFFLRNFEVLLKRGLFSRTIADPGFGFCKKREQNFELMAALPELMDELGQPQWLWGLSRKSFLRGEEERDPRDPATRRTLDAGALLWTERALKALTQPHQVGLRVHDPAMVRGLVLSEELRRQGC